MVWLATGAYFLTAAFFAATLATGFALGAGAGAAFLTAAAFTATVAMRLAVATLRLARVFFFFASVMLTLRGLRREARFVVMFLRLGTS